ncbi:chloramphenicol phosphotransferase [Actinopolymorpha sp. B9G3]|uniref:chloramphenicol phosphotransferase CPT family protein n=1 Tax=Actinopolymorpha sp. B9G3 TaxID=3158970 RepID=UPI0032D8CE3E
MSRGDAPGTIVILNGTPRSGKSSIAAAIQERFAGVWMNLGVDTFKRMTPARFQPGLGQRPGGERPDLDSLVVTLYRGMYEAIATHSRLGVNVVVDAAHHDAYSVPRGILQASAHQLTGLPALFVGVRCPVEVVLERRRATWGGVGYAQGTVRDPVKLWEQAVHEPGVYDLEVDTSVLSPEGSADQIRQRLDNGPPPSALDRLRAQASSM